MVVTTKNIAKVIIDTAYNKRAITVWLLLVVFIACNYLTFKFKGTQENLLKNIRRFRSPKGYALSSNPHTTYQTRFHRA